MKPGNFQEEKRRAQRQTTWLLGGFIVLLLTLVLSFNLITWLLFVYLLKGMFGLSLHFGDFLEWFWPWGAGLSLALLLGIAWGSYRRMRQIQRGGDWLAARIGARPICPNTAERQDRMLQNVTEEMAIAAGIRPPRLYVMEDEPGINAMVLGCGNRSEVIVCTRGAIAQLSRPALQALVAHEISHILARDTVLFMRLIGLLGGLNGLYSLGKRLLRNEAATSRSLGLLARRDRSDPILGLVFCLLGGLGVGFASLLQAGVCRQREWHADAEALRLTRYPPGLGEALAHINQHPQQGRLQNPLAHEFNPALIVEGVRGRGWLAAHPPLSLRLKKLGVSRHWKPAQAARKEPETKIPVSTRAHAYDRLSPEQARLKLIELLSMDQGHLSLENQPAHERLGLLERLLIRVEALPAACKQETLAQLTTQLGERGSLSAWCYLSLVDFHLGQSDDSQSAAVRHVHSFAQLNVELALCLSLFCRLGEPAAQAEARFRQLSKLWFPLESLRFRNKVTGGELSAALRELQGLSPWLKPTLMEALTSAVQADGLVKAQEYELLRICGLQLDQPLPARLNEPSDSGQTGLQPDPRALDR